MLFTPSQALHGCPALSEGSKVNCEIVMISSTFQMRTPRLQGREMIYQQSQSSWFCPMPHCPLSFKGFPHPRDWLFGGSYIYNHDINDSNTQMGLSSSISCLPSPSTSLSLVGHSFYLPALWGDVVMWVQRGQVLPETKGSSTSSSYFPWKLPTDVPPDISLPWQPLCLCWANCICSPGRLCERPSVVILI